VPDVGGDGLLAVAVEDAAQQRLAARERFVPSDLAPRGALADHRTADAVGVVVQRAQHGALRTDVALAPDVVGVGSHRDHALAVHLDLEAAHGFAERTGAEVRRGRHAATLASAQPRTRPRAMVPPPSTGRSAPVTNS